MQVVGESRKRKVWQHIMAPKKLHHRILDSLSTAIILIDRDMTVAYLNASAEAMLEVSGLRMQGEPITQLFNEDDDLTTNLDDAYFNETSFTKRQSHLNLPSGRTLTVDYAVTPMFEDGEKRLIIELQPLDRLLKISREEGLLSSEANTRALIRGIAHEVKNPLGGLRGAAQLLAKELPEGSLQDYTNIIIEEADRLRNLVDSMLGPRQMMALEHINIHEVLERVRHLAEAESSEDLTIERDYDPSIPDIYADRELLIQSTLNIVRNAVQAIQESGTSPGHIILRSRTVRQYTIGSQRHKLVCRIEIRDNGPGIPEELLESLFFPMVSGRAEGTGLGLSIAQSIVSRHKGLIECNSEPDGTVFSLNIPFLTEREHQ